MAYTQNAERGVSVIEVLIALSFAGVLIAAIGNALTGVHKLDTASAMREQATSFARESLETVIAEQKSLFVCSAGTGGVIAGTQCTTSEPQTCDVRAGYTSCWTPFPRGPVSCTTATPCHLFDNGTAWQLIAGSENPAADTRFTRGVIVETLSRDTSTGAIVPTGTPGSAPDNDTKRVIVSVSWQENSQPKNVDMTEILTGWKNVP